MHPHIAPWGTLGPLLCSEAESSLFVQHESNQANSLLSDFTDLKWRDYLSGIQSEKFPPFLPSLPNPKYLNWMQLDKKNPKLNIFII